VVGAPGGPAAAAFRAIAERLLAALEKTAKRPV